MKIELVRLGKVKEVRREGRNKEKVDKEGKTGGEGSRLEKERRTASE